MAYPELDLCRGSKKFQLIQYAYHKNAHLQQYIPCHIISGSLVFEIFLSKQKRFSAGTT